MLEGLGVGMHAGAVDIAASVRSSAAFSGPKRRSNATNHARPGRKGLAPGTGLSSGGNPLAIQPGIYKLGKQPFTRLRATTLAAQESHCHVAQRCQASSQPRRHSSRGRLAGRPAASTRGQGRIEQRDENDARSHAPDRARRPRLIGHRFADRAQKTRRQKEQEKDNDPPNPEAPGVHTTDTKR